MWSIDNGFIDNLSSSWGPSLRITLWEKTHIVFDQIMVVAYHHTGRCVWSKERHSTWYVISDSRRQFIHEKKTNQLLAKGCLVLSFQDAQLTFDNSMRRLMNHFNIWKNSSANLWKNCKTVLRMASSNPAPILTVSSSTESPSFLSTYHHLLNQKWQNWPLVSFGFRQELYYWFAPRKRGVITDYGQKVWILKGVGGFTE